nr:MAG: hypothetical protein DiTV3a_F7ORF5 [Diabrotica toursvirus 3a]
MKILRNDIEVIVKRKKSGEPASKIAKDYGVSTHAIYKVVSKWEMDNDKEIKERKDALKKTVLLHRTTKMMEEAGIDQETISRFLLEQQLKNPASEILLEEKEKEILLLKKQLSDLSCRLENEH